MCTWTQIIHNGCRGCLGQIRKSGPCAAGSCQITTQSPQQVTILDRQNTKCDTHSLETPPSSQDSYPWAWGSSSSSGQNLFSVCYFSARTEFRTQISNLPKLAGYYGMWGVWTLKNMGFLYLVDQSNCFQIPITLTTFTNEDFERAREVYGSLDEINPLLRISWKRFRNS